MERRSTRWISVLALLALFTGQRAASQNAPRWRFPCPDEIKGFTAFPNGIVVVRWSKTLTGIDIETGAVRWSRTEPRGGFSFTRLRSAPYFVLADFDHGQVIESGTGTTVWTTDSLPLQWGKTYLPTPVAGLLLIAGTSRRGRAALLGVELATGKVKWVLDDAVSADMNLAQPAIVNSDTTMVLLESSGAMTRIHTSTGARLWTSDALSDADPPTFDEGYPHVLAAAGKLFVPYARSLMAVRQEDGRILWEVKRAFVSPVAQLGLTPHGLLVRGAPRHSDSLEVLPFLDLLDPETGASRWRKRFRHIGTMSEFVTIGDTAYVATTGFLSGTSKLRAINLTDGARRELGKVKFEGDDPVALEARPEGFLLASREWTALLDRTGQPQYRRYYPAPGSGLLSDIFGPALSVAVVEAGGQVETMAPSASSTPWRGYAYFETKGRDSSGSKGVSLVTVRKRDGHEVARVWLGERLPDYVLDLARGIVVLQQGRDLVAARLPKE